MLSIQSLAQSRGLEDGNPLQGRVHSLGRRLLHTRSKSVKANIVESSISTITGHLLKKSDPDFCGANLSVVKIEEVHLKLSA